MCFVKPNGLNRTTSTPIFDWHLRLLLDEMDYTTFYQVVDFFTRGCYKIIGKFVSFIKRLSSVDK